MLKELQQLALTYGNDSDLGNSVRKLIKSKEESIQKNWYIELSKIQEKSCISFVLKNKNVTNFAKVISNNYDGKLIETEISTIYYSDIESFQILE